MLDAIVVFKLPPVLRPKNWRAAIAYSEALAAHDKGNYQRAIVQFERAISVNGLRTSEHMAFYAFLLVLNERPAKEALSLFTRVAAGEFRSNRDEWPYAEAWAQYWVAFLTGSADMFQRWLHAMKLRPAKGFAARRLNLPDNPVDPSESQGKVVLYN